MFIEDPKNRFVEPALRALKEVEAPKPFTLESLVAWLEKQNPAVKYCYTDNGHCLVGQYVSEICGLVNPNVSACLEPDPLRIYHGEYGEHTVEAPWEFDAISCPRPRTFGAALERARTLLSSRTEGPAPNTPSQENGK